MDSKRLSTDNTLLMIVDIQEKFVPVIHKSEPLLKNVRILIEMATQLEMPVLVTEQYPQGLGPTDESIKNLLPEHTTYLEKTAFGCLGDDAIREFISATGKKQIILCGIETHVCINQTAHQLLEAGYQVHIVQDAVSSRNKKNKKVALAKMFQSGAIPACTEMVLFELIEDARHPDFKSLQELVKN